MNNRSLVLVNVGTDERPADHEDEYQVERDFLEYVKANNLPLIPLVFAIAVDISLFPPFRTNDMPEKATYIAHVKVGSESRPATEEDIDRVREKVERIIEESGLNVKAWVTHHAMSIDMFPPME